MSEWGNPAGVMPGHFLDESIVRGEPTRGTETSQYPEEERPSIGILPVAASERGRAQTVWVQEGGSRCPRGVEDRFGVVCRPPGSWCGEAEPGWKVGPETVRAR